MCLDPISLTIGLLQTGVGLAAGIAEQNAAEERFQENAREANRALANSYAFSQLRIRQEQAAASQEQFENNIEARRAVGTARVTAGEAGVSGSSVNATLADMYGRKGRSNANIASNFQMTRGAIRAQMEAHKADAANRINSLPRGDKSLAFLDAGVRLLGNFANSHTTYLQNKKYP